MLSVMLNQHKDFYGELILQLCMNWKKLVEIISEKTSKKLDEVIKGNQDVKSSLQFTEGFVNELN